MNRVGAYLKAKSVMKMALHYPKAVVVQLEAEDMGAAQGRNWKLPMMLVPWRDLVDVSITEIREEYGITNAPPPGYWDWSTAASEDPRYPAPQAVAAE